MRKVVFDIETANEFSEVGSSDPAALDISVVGIHDSETDTYRAYVQDELPELWQIIERTDILIGYNSDHFDVPLLNKYYPGELAHIKSVDLMKAIKDSLGRRLKLDNIAGATLGTKKSGHGLQALEWWREGRVEEVKKYCLDDVRITKELYEYALTNGHLKYTDWNETKEIPLDVSQWEKASDNALTHTLPF